MDGLIPYVMFNGDCREAFHFYAEYLNGEIEFMQSYGDSPMDVSDDSKDKIMHATVRTFAGPIMGSDYTDEADYTAEGSASNVHLSLTYKDAADMDKAFEKLSEGGSVTMALADQFWGDRFGMLTDRFGVHWMFSCPAEKKE